MVDFEAPTYIDKICRGGEHCCNRGKLNLCGIGEGDCNTDNDCGGVLMCGKNNCMKWRPPGGRWDEEDDCCEKRCTPEHPCKEGGGHCDVDADCQNGEKGILKCGDNSCLNTDYFPRNIFVRNSETFGFTTTDNCCYKPCNKRYHLCGQDEVGCEDNEDCLPGYYCVKSAAQPYCSELNECLPNNGHFEGLAYCGQNTICTNTIGSFTCTCKTGFYDFVDHSGCIDIDECANGTAGCGPNTNCWNFPGHAVCTCKVGYIGSPKFYCYDIDECINADMNDCDNFRGYNIDTFGQNGIKYFDVEEVDTADELHHTYKFEVAAPGSARFYVGFDKLVPAYYVLLNPDKVEIYYCPAACNLLSSISQSLEMSSSKFDLYFMDVYYDSAEKQTTISLLDRNRNSLIEAINPDEIPIVINTIGVANTGLDETAYWRNMKEDKIEQLCVNTIGSYFCQDLPDEKIAIGFGGYTTSATNYPSQVSVFTSQKYTCSHHSIDSLQGRYSPGIAEIDGWLYICGGSYNGASTPLIDCKKFDLNSKNGSWIEAPNLPRRRRHFQMLAWKSSIFVIGGEDFLPSVSINTMHELNHKSNVWTKKADLPYSNHRFCAVADEEDDKIWMIGGSEIGVGDKMGVYYFTVSTNLWTFHSDLFKRQTVMDSACGIVYRRTKEKMLLVVRGGLADAVIYFDLTNNLGWNLAATLFNNLNQRFMRMITLTPYNAFIVGGNSGRYGNSLKNIFEFNHDTTNFEDNYYYLQNEMHNSAWTTVKKSNNYKALQDCTSIREYAAVCWGGRNESTVAYTETWSVILRSRSRPWEPHLPGTCHLKLSNLSPGRVLHGVTAVNYDLIVCGGNLIEEPHAVSSCYILNTNENNPEWYTMASMPIARRVFGFVTFGDAAFAIAGFNTNYISQVDRWTKSKGWKSMASYPIQIARFCAVADHGYDQIYGMGGRTDPYGYNTNAVYAYRVSKDQWASMPSLLDARSDIGCSIIRRRTTGNRMITVVGGGSNSIQYFDLTAYETNSNVKWVRGPTAAYTSSATRIESLTPYESLEVTLLLESFCSQFFCHY